MQVTIGRQDDFLFEVYAVDFGDNYHRTENEPSSELERAAKKIRRRYKDVNQYLEALSVYKEYMARLMLRHGGPKLFKIKLRDGMIPEFVPPKPRIKKTPLNKAILKKGIVISSTDSRKVNEDIVERTAQALSKDVSGDGIYIDTETKVPEVEKMIKKGQISPRVEVKKIRSLSSAEFLEEYFNNKNLLKAKKKQNTPEEDKLIPLTDIMSGKALEDQHDTEEEDDIIFYRGNYINRQSADELQLYQKLGELGWNALKIMKNHGVGNRITKIIKSEKKMNKKKKKKKSFVGSDFVQALIDDGYDTFGDYQRDMLNMTSSNVFD